MCSQDSKLDSMQLQQTDKASHYHVCGHKIYINKQ